MSETVLGLRVGPAPTVLNGPREIWGHNPAAALFVDGELEFGVEEKRLTRTKLEDGVFPQNAVTSCLDYGNLSLDDVDKVAVGFDPSLLTKNASSYFRMISDSGQSLPWKMYYLTRGALAFGKLRFGTENVVRDQLSHFGNVPTIEWFRHHRCHAASAFYPSGFDEALVVTVDGRGEFDSTVVWHADGEGLREVRTYPFPNSWGRFYGNVTMYLGYRLNNGEGKVMGLAPYGSENPDLRSKLLDHIDVGVDYDVTALTDVGFDTAIDELERVFDRPRREPGDEFEPWHEDVAYLSQQVLEETMTDVVSTYCRELGVSNVCLAGGVALNCKMNKEIRELDEVEDLFVQPVAGDAGIVLGSGWLTSSPEDVSRMEDVYLGPAYSESEIESLLEKNKIPFYRPDDLAGEIARSLADGDLVGWFQGRLEMGPRALGNRSILADPREEASREKINRYVKHREEWRPFAPSMTEEAASTYLENTAPSPFMIDTFDTDTEKREEIEAVLHPADGTTRPQIVSQEQNPTYHELIETFGEITGVPVLLNTSFNDHGEPIVTRPSEALKDFYGMGLDVLVLEEFVIRKNGT